MAGMSLGVYWESGWTMMTMSAPSCKRQAVAALLIAAVAQVPGVRQYRPCWAASCAMAAVSSRLASSTTMTRSTIPCAMTSS